MDPLRCLRRFCVENKLCQVKLVDSNKRVLFGDEYEFPADVETNFISINGMPYSLGSLLFYIQNCDLEPSKYYKLALQARIAQVYTANQLQVKEYLHGKLDHLPSVPNESSGKRKLEDLESVEACVPVEAKTKYRRSDLERSLRSRENLLIVANKDFSNILKIYSAAERAAKQEIDKINRTQSTSQSKAHPKSSRLDRGPVEASKQHQQLGVNIYASSKQPRPPPGRPQTSVGHSHRNTHSSQKGRPIIIVPEGVSALMSLFNTQKLLQEGEFMTTAEARAGIAGGDKPSIVLVSRKQPTDPARTITYELVDQPPSKSSPRWERVAAVICQGKRWQFKEYPFKGAESGDLVELFTSICGFYFYYRGETVPDTIKSWNVTPLALDRAARYSDIQTVQTFFQALTKFLDNKSKTKSRKGCRPDKVLYK
eukprot:jgi/Ulvmu1/7260/UM035_0047.1